MKWKNKNGITLIALVITIIVLLILAGVVLNLTLGEHGILKQAQQGAEQYKISEILEKLELEKVDLYARKNGEVPSLQEYIDHLINKGIITQADVTDIDANNKNIVVEGYLFLVEKEASGNIKITYQGKATKEPRIASLQVMGTTIDSISIKVIASNADGASYKYSIKNVTAGETSFTLIDTNNSNEYTFIGLPTNNDYMIQVELVTNEGTDIKEIGTIKTEPPRVTTITLDKNNISLVVGGTDNITATVLPTDAIDKTLTWTSSNEGVVTVDNTGLVTAIGDGVAIITVTSNDVNTVTANCNITVTPPPPPSAGVGAETHEAHEIQYTWEELSQIAKVISDNYGTTEEGKINNDTAEVNVSINGKADTLGIGDWTTVDGKRVRILGFNHDELATSRENDDGTTEAIAPQYGIGTTNIYAGISFEFVNTIMKSTINNNRPYYGWGACALRGTLNSTIYDSLENKAYIKEVNKEYIKTYNDADSVTTSQDKLWLLSCSEIWNNGVNEQRPYGHAIAKEGEQYKYYKNINANCNELNEALSKIEGGYNVAWFLRSASLQGINYYTYVSRKVFQNSYSGSISVMPGFSI